VKLELEAHTTHDGSPFVLRTPLPEDAAAMLVFLRQLLHESSEHLNAPSSGYDGVDIDSQVATLERMLAADRSFYLSAFDGEAMVGNLVFSPIDIPVSQHCGQLGMGVLATHQGRGVASALLSRCIAEAGKLGIWNIRFTVRTYNQRAISLYERHGFRRVGRLERVAKIGDAHVDEFMYQGVFAET
jgi:RimJ/RimL family protein N-acetyltransferase